MVRGRGGGRRRGGGWGGGRTSFEGRGSCAWIPAAPGGDLRAPAAGHRPARWSDPHPPRLSEWTHQGTPFPHCPHRTVLRGGPQGRTNPKPSPPRLRCASASTSGRAGGGGEMAEHSATHAAAPAFHRAGISGATPHDLRRTCGSFLLCRGVADRGVPSPGPHVAPGHGLGVRPPTPGLATGRRPRRLRGGVRVSVYGGNHGGKRERPPLRFPPRRDSSVGRAHD